MIRFLTLAEALLICEDQLRRYGGIYGVRDLGLLNSALYQSQSTFEGVYLHESIPAMAAAYGYHICKNHPFLDGNKRVALASALVFLDLNGWDFDCDNDEIYGAMMAVASGKMDKNGLTALFLRCSKQR